MAVEVTIGPSFKAGVPKPLFDAPIHLLADPYGALWIWDVAPDGQRFLITAEPAGNTSTPITVVLNWQAGRNK